jgi:exopolysaccharide production protein ExoQ
MLSELVFALPYLFMVALALGLALAGLLQYRLAGRITPEARVVAVVLIVGAGALLSVALTSRTLNEAHIESGELIVTYDDFAKGFAASRWLSLFLIGVSLIEVARGWIRARAAESPDPARPVLWALLAYYFGTLLVQAVASDNPGFSHRALYVPAVLLAMYYQRPHTLAPILTAAKWAILAVTVGSLIGIVVRPDFVMHRPEPGWIPGVDWRLFGLTPHANTLGPIALLAILLELQSPSRWRLVRWLHLLPAAAVFVLAQSKTAWAAAPLILAVVYVPLALQPSANAAGRERSFNRAAWTLVGFIAILVLLCAAFVAFDALDVIQRKTDLATLTGRTQIWDITLRAWRDNILFGYGPEVWGLDRRLQLNMFHVGHAHNQVVQTLGEAGLVGLMLLLVYLITLFHAALHRFVASRGIVLMLLLLMLVRCVTEAPLRVEGLLSWATFLHVLVLVLACHYLREPVREGPRTFAVRARPASGYRRSLV